MDEESESHIPVKGDSSVKDLQSLLFPVSPRKSSSDSFLSSFFLKSSSQTDIDEDRLGQVVKFKDSKEYIFKDVNCSLQPPRWPTECQVLEEQIEHIPYVPSFPEPYYTQTGKEVQPKPISDDCGMVVYQYYPISTVNYFSRSSVGGSKYLLPTCPCPEEDSLRFESRFESGNLAKAIKITATYYELYLRTDLYTNRFTQWFYFRVTNMRKNNLYRFSIVNLSKEESLYNEGMKMIMYSVKDAQLHSIGWRRCGDNITYFCNENVSPEDPDQQMLYTLTFTVEFPHEDDTVYLAHSYPYTYTDLQNYLQEMTSHPVKSTFTTLRLLCRTLAGNNVYYVTITAPQVSGDNKNKRAVVITSRVHPGETPSSWMMKGFLDFLTSDSAPAKELRERFIFKLVPMLNPDGVIIGNSRCSLTARDLNRQYRTVIRETYPSIWYTKLMIRRLIEECGVAMYCDLHAHSRKHNIFIYGCENRKGIEKRLHEQVFPLMLHKNAADKFSFENCKFRVQKCKEGTGRVVMWMMGIANSFTMEASFAGSRLSTRTETHFTTMDYEMMGRSFCQTLLDFYDDDPRKERLRMKILNRLVKEGSNADEPTNIQLSDYSSDSGSSSSSEEGGGRDYELPLAVPPPSPALVKKLFKPKSVPAKPSTTSSKSPSRQRKPLPLQLFKATLGLTLSQEKTCYSSGSDTYDSDSETVIREKMKAMKKRKKKKKAAKKGTHVVQVLEYSDTEIQIKKSTERCISVLEMLPESKLRSKSWHRNSRVPQLKPMLDVRKTTTQQLAEVQAKLISLKNKLWFGIGDNELGAPLSFGFSNFCISSNSTVQIPNKKGNQKQGKKKVANQEKNDKKTPTKKIKNKEEPKELKEKSSKKEKQNGIKRQTTIEWMALNEMTEKIRKLKSLTDTSAKPQKANPKNATAIENAIAKCDATAKAADKNLDKKNSKKKKKKTKLGKTAKTVSNANLFIKRD